MPPPQATSEFYATVQQYELLLIAAGQRLWRRMLPGDFDGSWARIAQQMVAFTAGAQLAAATAAVEYVPTVLEETGQPDRPEARVRPQAFSGRATDGGTLTGLLEGSVVAAKEAARTRIYVDEFGKRTTVRGKDGGDALADGLRWLEQALQTAVADAARDATAASIIARPGIGWVRMVNPPCCSRCAVLAGAVYRWSDGFRRHPRCDCLHIPTTVANADTYLSDLRQLVERGLITDLSQNQRKRLDEGANLGRVLNESRDRWRERMALQRRAEKDGRARNYPERPAATVHDFMAHLTSRVDAINAMRAAGIAD